MSAVKKLLDETTCSSVLKTNQANKTAPAQPICLDANLSVQEGCSALANHKISSAPVYDSEEGGFIGMLDFRDLVTYVLEVFHKVPKEKHSVDAEANITDIVKLALSNNQGVPVKLISNLSKQNPLVAVQTSAPVSEAATQFADTGIHRVVIVEPTNDGSNKFIGVISQSTVCTLVANKFGKMAVPPPAPGSWPIGDKTIGELGLVKGGVVSISQMDTLLDALYAMHTHKVSSCAIVDRSQGYDQLSGAISMTDMKEIFSVRGGYRKLYDNAFQFFAQLRSQQGLEAHGNDRAPSFVIHPTTTLVTAIEKLAATHSHRLWVVEGNDKLVGVLSQTDFVKFFKE